jgi:phosphoribosyl-AMP cyclohydrolase
MSQKEILDFSKMGGLIPAIVQDAASGEVLMLAFMNLEAWELTLQTGEAHYYSRSRRKIWRKGETSGHVQRVKAVYLDCDQDTLLLKVEQVGGAACHTGHRSCFYRRRQGEEWRLEGALIFDPQEVYRGGQ